MIDENILDNPSTQVDDIPDMNEQPGLEPIGGEPTVEPPVTEPVSDPNATPAEPDASPTPLNEVDKAKDRAAKFQTRYQNALAKLQTFMTPVEYEQFKATAGMPQQPHVAPTAAPAQQEKQYDNFYDMPPDVFLAKVQGVIEKTTNEKLSSMQAKQRMDGELSASSQELMSFVQEGQFTDEQVKSAMDYANSLPFDYTKPGVFAHKTNIVMEKLMESIRGEHIAGQIQQGQIDAAQKAKAMATIAQPPAGSQPLAPNLSFQRQALKEMQGLRRRSSASLIDKK